MDAFRSRPDVVVRLHRDTCTGLEKAIANMVPDDSNCDKGMHIYLGVKQTLGRSLVADGFKRERINNHFRLVVPTSFSTFATEICFTRGSVDGDLVEISRKGPMFHNFMDHNGQFVVQGEFDYGLPVQSVLSRLILIIDIREDAVAASGYSGSVLLIDGECSESSGEVIRIKDQLLLGQFPDFGDFAGGHYEAPSLD